MHPMFASILPDDLFRWNTLVVLTGTTCFGAAAGVVGCFAYLRKRAMMGDALSHATLPGVAAAFVITASKGLGVLMVGAITTGVLGVLCVIAIRRYSRIKEDAAIGIVLSVFFGAGAVLLGVARSVQGDVSGLNTFIYGKAAGMLESDARLIAVTTLVVIGGTILLYKEFRAVCFDYDYAAAQGWPVLAIDLLMMGLIVLTTVIGLQAVGMLLVVAMLIIPAAAARFWTDSLAKMVALAGIFGAASGTMGSLISAGYSDMPTGAIIVICAGGIFAVSMIASPRRGVLASVLRNWMLRRKIAHQHLLRSLVEHEEQFGEGVRMGLSDLLRCRSWSPAELKRVLARDASRNVVTTDPAGMVGLTAGGRAEARRVLRNHRLWEMYLIRHADIAPSHVDRDADEIEHVLSEEIILELEAALAQETAIPPSPHVAEGT